MAKLSNQLFSKKNQLNSKNQGFTLVELVIVIVLLGILSVGISGFLRFGSEIFVDVKNRSEIVATARFAMERLNRELRSALPNSVQVIPQLSLSPGGIQCIRYTPIVATANYLDIPTDDETAVNNNTISVVSFTEDALIGLDDYQVALYPTNSNDVYGATNKVVTLTNAQIDKSQAIGTSAQWDINFTNDVSFTSDSPTSRLYFIGDVVNYCVGNTVLKRFVGADIDDITSSISFFNKDQRGVLMATDLISYEEDYPFRVSASTQERNSTALIKLVFEKNQEQITFNNEVHIPNAP